MDDSAIDEVQQAHHDAFTSDIATHLDKHTALCHAVLIPCQVWIYVVPM